MVTTEEIPALVRGTVSHMRQTPIRHGLRFDTYQWLIDLSAVPSMAPFITFPVRDHFGGGAASLRDAVVEFAEAQGEQVQPSDRVLMLSAGRSFGYAFDPLSVFWCIDATGAVRWIVLEIHNTYGDRHAHLVHLDGNGRASLRKEFYVSPFFSVDGRYDVVARIDDDKVAVSINLHQNDAHVFSASFVGRAVPMTTPNFVRAFLRTPFATLQTTTRIRVHGIWLWLRRLPVVPRPVHVTQAGFR